MASGFRRLVLGSCAAFALITGCSASQREIGTPAEMPESSVSTTRDGHGQPWILPEAKTEALLYVATGDNVYILSYPAGKLTGALNVSGYGLCSDKKGDVFVLGVGYDIYEYAHAATSPVQVLNDGDVPIGCSVDRVTGNLAVTSESSFTGGVLIFPNAQSPAQGYGDSDVIVFGLCGYDDHGNLFFGGKGSTADYFAELPKGGNAIKNFTLGPKLYALGGVQWDGKHMTLSNPSADEVFRLSLGKSSVKIVGETQISAWQSSSGNSLPYTQTWIHDGVFLGQTTTLAEVGVWPYPAGGNPRKVLSGFASGNVNISGITISVAP